MSAKPAAIPLFGDAYLADTRHLTTEEHGAYLLLMMAAWRQDDCALPDDDHKLARITGLTLRKWTTIKPTMMEFWQVENGRIFQGRLRKERAYVDQKSESNRKSAEARWSKQATENKQSGECERISECNAPPPSPPQKEVSKKGAKAPRERKRSFADWPALPAWLPAEPWAAFLDVRWKKGAWPTPHAVGLLIADLDGWRAKGHDPGPILNASTKNNWTGLFEPKAPQNAQQPPECTDELRNPYARAAVANQAGRARDGEGCASSWPQDSGSAPRVLAIARAAAAGP